MILDCHIHMGENKDTQTFRRQLNEAGVDGGIIFSASPAAFHNQKPTAGDARKRVDQVLAFTHEDPHLYPFFWIDPTEDDAVEQVEMAAEAGVAGFKIICGKHYPQDDRAMKTYERMAACQLPVLFHSGILYDNAPSGDFNRPCNFEHLFFVEGLRFALAHISWPWCDELISVFGKWNYLAFEQGIISAEMYVDLTPGTPDIYREEALRKLIMIEYPSLTSHMIFGTDGSTNYNVPQIRRYIARDHAIYDRLNVPEDVRTQIFYTNTAAFIGIERP